MNQIQQLINQMCPNGVEWKTLGEVGTFFNGVTGKSKKDFENGNAKFISYMNVFSNPKLKIDVEDTILINKGEKQNTLQYGDVIFTTSSETPDESGMSSVLTTHTDEKLYLNSFCFGFRFNNLEIISPDFYSYIFRSEPLRNQIIKCANGVTRFNISKASFAKVKIPLPPLAIQTRIVEILDHFTNLTANLNEELNLRRKQFEYYREKLLAFGEDVEWKKLGEVAEIKRGKRLTTKQLDTENGFPVYHGGIEPIGFYHSSNRPANTVMVINVGASAGTVGFCDVDFWSSDGCFCICQNDSIRSKYLFYHLIGCEHQLKTKVRHAGIPTLDNKVVESVTIPIPPLAVQTRIVSILDKFTALIENIEKELALRQKQYEYYREELLRFERSTF